MIKEATYYEVICDKCGERMCLDDVCAWESEEDAKEALDYVGWQEMESGRVYCDACLDSGEINLQQRYFAAAGAHKACDKYEPKGGDQ